MQELLLRRLLAGQEVQVVQQQGVALAELLAEAGQLAECRIAWTKRLVNSSAVTKHDAPVGAALAQADVDAFEQVRLAGADRAVEDQRVGRPAPAPRRRSATAAWATRLHGPTTNSASRCQRRTAAASAGPAGSGSRRIEQPGWRLLSVSSARPAVGPLGEPVGVGSACPGSAAGRRFEAFTGLAVGFSAGNWTAACSARAAWNSGGSMANRTGTARPAASWRRPSRRPRTSWPATPGNAGSARRQSARSPAKRNRVCGANQSWYRGVADPPDEGLLQRSDGGGRSAQTHGAAPGAVATVGNVSRRERRAGRAVGRVQTCVTMRDGSTETTQSRYFGGSGSFEHEVLAGGSGGRPTRRSARLGKSLQSDVAFAHRVRTCP